MRYLFRESRYKLFFLFFRQIRSNQPEFNILKLYSLFDLRMSCVDFVEPSGSFISEADRLTNRLRLVFKCIEELDDTTDQ